jgi:transposase InsO family protein
VHLVDPQAGQIGESGKVLGPAQPFCFKAAHLAGRGGRAGDRPGLVNRLPKAIEWLSDNGSPYTARETRALARDIGLMPRTTPIESPQSNGMAEAFVKTIKRDYARVSERPDAASVLGQLDSWFEHYNSVHPHKALGYRAPREFRNQMVARTTENAVGAVRRPHEDTTSAEAIGSRPSAAHSAVAQSASLDVSAAADHR